ncbi:MAG: hypothetical protein LBP25_04490 [Tannerellaceae bacterium]|jgi:hypothetical protein|nr:hypothetical protein [Tannerellaceae bacterium]
MIERKRVMAKRIHTSKEEKDENRTLDDRHELLNIYESKCCRCEHFQEWDFFCAAFPGGIPDEYLSGKKVHNKIDKNQVGNAVFTEQT